MTRAAERVLAAFLQAPDEGTYGYALSAASGASAGTVYPLLARLEQIGWIESLWEQPGPGHEQMPRRRLYQLTTDGRQHAAAILPRPHTERTTRPVRGLRPQPGLA
jgi:PadR family transcriptional regulator, regulatory protein PadR